MTESDGDHAAALLKTLAPEPRRTITAADILHRESIEAAKARSDGHIDPDTLLAPGPEHSRRPRLIAVAASVAVVVAAVAIAVSVVGHSDTSGRPAAAAPSTDQPTTRRAPVSQPSVNGAPVGVFSGRRTLQTIQSAPTGSSPGASVPARRAPAGAYVVWDSGKLTGSDGCNDFRATYRYTDTTLTISNVAFPRPRPCPSAYGWTSILTGVTHWSSDGTDLTITDSHGERLVFNATNR